MLLSCDNLFKKIMIKKKKKNLGESSADFCTWTTEENLVESLVRERRAYCFVTTEISGLNNGTPNQWGFSLKTLTLNWGCASPLGWDVRCHFKNSIIQRFTQKRPFSTFKKLITETIFSENKVKSNFYVKLVNERKFSAQGR